MFTNIPWKSPPVTVAHFLDDPLLRGGFLDDVYECFEDPQLADEIMTAVSEDVPSFAPLIAHRCVLSGWKPTPLL